MNTPNDGAELLARIRVIAAAIGSAGLTRRTAKDEARWCQQLLEIADTAAKLQARADERRRVGELVGKWRKPTPQDECTLYTMGQRSGRNACADELAALVAMEE